MDRRTFTKSCLLCTGAIFAGMKVSQGSARDEYENKNAISKEAKKMFWKYGCAGALYHALSYKFDNFNEAEERTIGLTLSGGIAQMGYQCGMLWGASMAASAEAFRKFDNEAKATVMAITASKKLVESFTKKAKHANCRDITNVNWHSKTGMMRYFLTGKLFTCMKLADDWPPEAVGDITDVFTHDDHSFTLKPLSCSSEVVKRMGGSQRDIQIVAGLAGGIGLSGNACGALGAAVWIKSKEWMKDNPKFNAFENPGATSVLDAFDRITGGEKRCDKLCGRCFKTVDEHTQYINDGGCGKVIEGLSGV